MTLKGPVMRCARRHLLQLGGIAVVTAMLTVVSGSTMASSPAEDASTATAFMEQLSDQAIQALTQPDVPKEERERRARVLLRDNFAIPTIGQWVLGRYWRSATTEQREEYLRLFEDLIITTYVDRFSRFSGERLQVVGEKPIGESGDQLVETQIVRAGSNPVNVGWRVSRARDRRWQIVDVYVEGVSMGQTQRSEFASVIQNHGGSIDALIDEMRRRVNGNA